MIKKILLSLLLVFWMVLIFYFSNQPSVQSDSVSNGTMEKIIDITEVVIHHNFNETEIANIYKYGIFPLRKCAHLSIYFILGILFYSLISQYKLNNKKVFMTSLLFCIIYACSDEIHQLFILGRSGELRDVLIDSFGSLLGILLMSKILKK